MFTFSLLPLGLSLSLIVAASRDASSTMVDLLAYDARLNIAFL